MVTIVTALINHVLMMVNNMKIKVNTTDLIKKLEGFPFEIVEKMLEHQYAQNNIVDISVFHNLPSAEKYQGGFDWRTSPEGFSFWDEIIHGKNFDKFFERYPKRYPLNPKSKAVYIRGDVNNGANVIKELESRGGINIWNKMGNANHMLYFIDPVTNYIERAVDPQCKNLLRTYYTEILPGDYTMVEITMGEIAEKLGIDVNKLRIKK